MIDWLISLSISSKFSKEFICVNVVLTRSLPCPVSISCSCFVSGIRYTLSSLAFKAPHSPVSGNVSNVFHVFYHSGQVRPLDAPRIPQAFAQGHPCCLKCPPLSPLPLGLGLDSFRRQSWSPLQREAFPEPPHPHLGITIWLYLLICLSLHLSLTSPVDIRTMKTGTVFICLCISSP